MALPGHSPALGGGLTRQVRRTAAPGEGQAVGRDCSCPANKPQKEQNVSARGQLGSTHRAQGACTGQGGLPGVGVHRVGVHRVAWMCAGVHGCAQGGCAQRDVHRGVNEHTQNKQQCA